MYVFPFGWSAYLCGTVYINRSNPGECKTLISRSAQEIQETKVGYVMKFNLCVYYTYAYMKVNICTMFLFSNLVSDQTLDFP